MKSKAYQTANVVHHAHELDTYVACLEELVSAANEVVSSCLEVFSEPIRSPLAPFCSDPNHKGIIGGTFGTSSVTVSKLVCLRALLHYETKYQAFLKEGKIRAENFENRN